MARIFVSYRREDGISQTGRIYDRLVGAYGDSEVFMDLGKISAGVDFTQVLEEKLAICEIFIAVIGPHWLVSRKGRRRLQDAEDFVRREINIALQRGVRILPVLVGDARMPAPADLPPELAGLARLNAVKIREERFDADMDSLLLDIEEPDRPPEDTLLRRLQDIRVRMRQRRDALLIGGAIVLASAAASWSDLFDLFALDTRLDTLTLFLGDLYDQPPPTDSVVIAGIDAVTEAALGRPFDRDWRRHHAMLVDRLREAGARTVAFDMYFEEPGTHDAAFVQALRRARAAGMSVYIGSRGGPPGAGIAGLREAVTGTGLVCIGHRLGYATTAPLWVGHRQQGDAGTTWQARRVGLGLAAALDPSPATLPDRAERTLLVPAGDHVRELDIGSIEQVKSPQTACPGIAVGDESAELFIRLSDPIYWRSPPRYVKYESLIDVGTAGSGATVDTPGRAGTPSASAAGAGTAEASAAPTRSEAAPHGALRGKTVLVGMAGAGVTADHHMVLRRFASEARHGVELHAEVISNLRQDRQVHSLHWGGQLLMTVVSVAVAAGVRLLTGNRQRLWRWGTVMIAVLLYLWLIGYLCARYQVLLNGIYHLAAFGIAYWLMGRRHARGSPPTDNFTGGRS